jgi:hypothetical protein
MEMYLKTFSGWKFDEDSLGELLHKIVNSSVVLGM